MSAISKKDLHTPFNNATITKLIGKIGEAWHEQAAAATAAGAVMVRGGPANHTGTIRSAYVVLTTAAGIGESMVYDLKVAGVTVLSSTLTVTNAHAAGVQIPLSVDPAKLNITAGQVITCDRTYVAGAGAMTNNAVYVEWS